MELHMQSNITILAVNTVHLQGIQKHLNPHHHNVTNPKTPTVLRIDDLINVL